MMVLGQYGSALVGTWWYWVSITWYMRVLGQYGAELVDIWWYWVNRRQYWLVLGGAGSLWGGTGWYLVILGQYNLLLLGIKWFWVSIGLYVCIYWTNGDLVGCYHSGTDRWRKGKIGLLSQMDHWRLSWAIAMVDSYSEDDLRRLRWQQWWTWWPIYPMGWRLKCATTQMFRFLTLFPT